VEKVKAKGPATVPALHVGDIIRRHNGKSYIGKMGSVLTFDTKQMTLLTKQIGDIRPCSPSKNLLTPIAATHQVINGALVLNPQLPRHRLTLISN
jgi:hypothetical protein